MRRSMQAVVVSVVVLTLSGPVLSDSEVDVSGQIRVRAQVDGRSFSDDATERQYADMRTRVGVKATIDDNVHVLVQMQDSRQAGGFNLFGEPTSGGLSDSKNIDLHQAYVRVDHLWEGGLGAQAGRFEVNLGNQRVFGAVGWSNVGRAWEGMKFWLDRPDYNVSAYWLKRAEYDDRAYNRDFDIFGGYARMKTFGLDLFGFWEHNADENDFTGMPTGANRLDRMNLGLYYQRLYEQFDFEMNGVYQTGEKAVGVVAPLTEMDISAFLITFEAGYNFDESTLKRLAVGIDYSSGDDDLTDTDAKAYDNLYYTGHKFRGYMDYFTRSTDLSNDYGLMDLVLRGKMQPTEGWTVSGDLHYFTTAQDYADLNGDPTSDVGVEFDLTVSTTRITGVTLVSGASLFMPSEAYAGMTDPNTGFWMYWLATADF